MLRATKTCCHALAVPIPHSLRFPWSLWEPLGDRITSFLSSKATRKRRKKLGRKYVFFKAKILSIELLREYRQPEEDDVSDERALWPQLLLLQL